MEEKITLTKQELSDIISQAFQAGQHEDENYEIAMLNLANIYVKAGISDLMPMSAKYEYDEWRCQ